MQPRVLSNLLCFCRPGIVARRCHASLVSRMYICGALRDLVAFVQFKKPEKHPWRSVNFSNNSPWVFFRFFKLYKCYQIAQRTTYWKKSVIWGHQFQPSIFSPVVSLFQGSLLSNSYVKDTVFISQHLLQPSIITSCLWLIWENLKGMLMKWTKLLAAIPFFYGECVNLTISQQQLQLFIKWLQYLTDW